MLQRHVGQVEVHAFQQEVGGHQHLTVGRIGQDGGIVAHTIFARLVLQFNALGEVADEAELAEGGYFCPHNYAWLISSRMISVILGCAASAAFCTSSCETSTILPSTPKSVITEIPNTRMPQ